MKKLWKLKINSKNAGRLAEFLCQMYMHCLGYKIIAKNYLCGSGKKTLCGELDFVAVKNKSIIFCEVKKRKHNEDFLKALSPSQQQRIVHGAQYFIMHHPQYKTYLVQFDVFFVRFPWSIKRIKNAFY